MKNYIGSLHLGSQFLYSDMDGDKCVYVVGEARKDDGCHECKSILIKKGKEWKESNHSTVWLTPMSMVEVVWVKKQKIEVLSISDHSEF